MHCPKIGLGTIEGPASNHSFFGRAKIVHLTLEECAKNLTLDDDFTLRLEGRRVGIVYVNRIMLGVTYRPQLFAAIRMIERSSAIKATSLFFELSTSKKIQQLLAMPGMIERFFPDPSEAQMVADIRNTFAKLWGLENDDEKTRAVIEAMSLLYFRVASDFDFLKMAYKDVIQSDKSVRMFMELLEEIKKEGIKQPLSLFLQRSDYMIHVSTDPQTNEPKYQLKQIEVNGGSIGTAGCIERLVTLHRRVLEKSGVPKRVIDNALPENRSGTALALTIFKAWEQLKDPQAIILFLVLKARSAWQFTKRYDEYELERLSGGRAKIVHLTLKECAENLTLDDDFTLRLEGRHVGIVYVNRIMLGVNYSPEAFAPIRMIESSKAIKATSLFFELSTSKKIQQ
uniref:Glutathione synthetase n=1 Tax=Globodera pallida TaxID=36090 RepID=A0A183C356_GLOPA